MSEGAQDPMDELRAMLEARAEEQGIDLDETALSALAQTLAGLTTSVLTRAVGHLRAPPKLVGLKEGSFARAVQSAS